MIFTSYWSLAKYVPEPISISLSQPKGFNYREYPKLMPTWPLVRDFKRSLISRKEYVKLYIELIESRDTVERFISELPTECTLMCWEKSGEFCHRIVFARYIKKKLGIEIKEWQPLTYNLMR